MGEKPTARGNAGTSKDWAGKGRSFLILAAMALLFVVFGVLGSADKECGGNCSGCLGACDNKIKGRAP